MTNYFIIPGLGNSGPDHWQTHFEKSGENFQRVNQQEWDSPEASDWIKTLDDALSNYDLSQVILIGHSLVQSQWTFSDISRYGKTGCLKTADTRRTNSTVVSFWSGSTTLRFA